MTEAAVQPDDVELGPIDYLVVEYPESGPTGEALPYLLDLVDRGLIRVLDVALVAKDSGGAISAVTLSDLPEAAQELMVLDGAATGLLDDDDLAEVGSVLTPGAIGAVLVYENTWAAGFATALRRAGAQVVANGRIPVNALLAAMEAEAVMEAEEEEI